MAAFLLAVVLIAARPAMAAGDWPDEGAVLTGLFGDPGQWAIWGAVLLGLSFALPTVLWQRWRLQRAGFEAASRTHAVTRLEEILLAAPDGYFRWDHAAEGEAPPPARCSRRLAVLLGLYGGIDAGWPEVLQSFGPEDAGVLDRAVAGLRQQGAGFEIEVWLAEGGRRVLITGLRAAAADGVALADVLWMRDVTEGTAEIDRLAADGRDLAAERDRLRALFDALPLPLWLRDPDLSLVTVNQAYARAVDAETPEAAAAQDVELVAGPGAREARALAARARAAGTPRAERFHLVMAGARRLVEITEAPLASGGGTLTAGCAIDRTREEELQGELDRHVAAHGEVLEHLSTAIAIFTTDTRLLFHNTAFGKLWGLEAEWLAQQPTYGNVLDTLRERRLLPEVADYRAFRADELKRFTSLIEPVEDLLHLPDEATLRRVIAAHPFGGLIFTYEDVTDTLALERSYNTSLAVQRLTLDRLHEGVAVFGADGRLGLSNPAYGRIWGLTPAELAGQPHVAELIDRHQPFFAEAAWGEVRARMAALFAERKARQGRLERLDGAILDYASVPLPDGALLMTWLDVSDSARVERALRERNDALAAANRLKSEFIANVSAEVRTPLNTVIGFAEILTHEYYGRLNKRQSEYARGITEAGQSLMALVADILDLAAIEAGQMALELGTFDLHMLLAGVLGLVRERVRQKQVVLHFDCPLDIGWMVGDERRIKQVLFTLVSSAVRLTPADGQITLAAQRDDAEVVFTVADTGAGLPPESCDLPEHAGPLAARATTSPGLGLSLVRRFVALHGGDTEVVTVAGEGTTVTVRLPAGRGTGGV